MIVTFCGHRTITNSGKVEAWLEETLRSLIAEGATIFYLGGYGAFDLLANCILTRLKEEHPICGYGVGDFFTFHCAPQCAPHFSTNKAPDC